jgi:coenzyme F420-0:L-glutamate ligase/coenzyme F420-1:gamma-L-glutamate ligase
MMKLIALEGVPEIAPGQALDQALFAALERSGSVLCEHDVIAICQKVVSKSEHRLVELTSVTPSARALELAERCQKDPRLVELVLRESTDVLRCVKDVLIVRHRLGFVVANAGVDQSNVPGGNDRALLLPLDPDASAARIRAAVSARFGIDVAVIITDSFGRPWRMGVCGTAIGCAGITSLLDARGRTDRFGRVLKVTQIAVADELAAAATLMMGEADEGRPMVVISGVPSQYFSAERPARDLVRSLREDLFT